MRMIIDVIRLIYALWNEERELNQKEKYETSKS